MFLADDTMRTASPLYWKSKQIGRVCYSFKDSETLTNSKIVDDVIFMSRQLELLLYGDYRKRIPIHLCTDSEGTLESIASKKQLERKSLCMVIQDLKERLVEGEILS